MKVSVLGAGSWGTALAMHLGRGGHDVLLWSRDPAVSGAIRETGRHPRRFPDVQFPPGIRASSDIREALSHSDTILVAVPCASYRPLLESIPGTEARRFVSTAKGIEPETLRRMSQIILEYQPGAEVAALSGPTFAEGVARGDPSAAVIADAGGTLARDVQGEFSNTQLRLYRSDDLQGVELAGALKNVVAIAAGIVAGLGFGANTIAALVTRGLAEVGRIVKAGGGQARTVAGLAGIGDLMLTCTGRESRNRRVGEAIGRGRRLPDVLVEMPEVAEGARTCLAVPRMAAAAGIEAPIADAVVSVLYEGVPAGVAVEKLMTRTLREE
ncbi:MAG: NAD(P)-dependent glycerol-3-phosphate dehydrogenase [Acidobacteriota bacterium]|nr:NAD(P)-dependent glycerol-3-phosphate dehydrogenase [Acidobacteriota bacterium]